MDNLGVTAGTANISICTVTIYGHLNNQPYLRTEKAMNMGFVLLHSPLPAIYQSRNSLVSISIGVTRKKVHFNKEITIKHFVSTAH